MGWLWNEGLFGVGMGMNGKGVCKGRVEGGGWRGLAG